MIGHKSLDELLNYSWISGSLWCIFVWYWPVMARPSFLLHHIRQPSLIDWQWWWWKSMGHRWETATKTPSTRCDFCRTTLMFVNIHGNRSILEHSTTFYNIGEQWSTMLNGRPHDFCWPTCLDKNPPMLFHKCRIDICGLPKPPSVHTVPVCDVVDSRRRWFCSAWLTAQRRPWLKSQR